MMQHQNFEAFGTTEFPLHASGLKGVLDCPWRVCMDYLFPGDEEHGVAGDTGSASHVAVAAFHRGSSAAEALEAMRAAVSRYPRADLQDAAQMFLRYSSDPRNRGIDTPLVEQPVAFDIAPAPEDHTKAPIAVIGTCDQVRRLPNGKLYVWDYKTSKKDPIELMHAHTFQVAGYCIGASVRLNERVNPGGIILPRRYRDGALEQSPVFYHYSWKFEDIEQIMKPIRHAVARIRAGDVWHIPNPNCVWCRARTPDVCLPKLQEVIQFLEHQHS